MLLVIRRASKNSYRIITIVALAATMLLSANVAMAAHQMIEKKSGALELQPTEAAGPNAAAQVEYGVAALEDGSATLIITPRISGMYSESERLMVFLIDREELRAVAMPGEVGEAASVRIDNLEDYDSIIIVRPSEDGYPGTVLFRAELSHNQQ